MKRFTVIGLVWVIFVAMITGCGSETASTANGREIGAETPPGNGKSAEDKNKPQGKATDPVTLTLYDYGGGIDNSEFAGLFADPVKKKYPNITMKFVSADRKNKVNMPEQLIASDSIPDLIFTGTGYVNLLKDLGLGLNLTSVAKEQKVDLNRFEPATINDIKSLDDKSELYALPHSMNLGVLVYNKDLFDKFGVKYPKDGMTWDDVLELTRAMTRSADGVQYYGIQPERPIGLQNQLSLPSVDPQGKAQLTSDGYVKVFNLLKQFFDIPGIKFFSNSGAANGFFKDQLIAMFPFWISGLLRNVSESENKGQNSLNWDIVSYPAFKDHPGIGKTLSVKVLMMTPQSKHRQEAIDVLKLIVSDEVQLEGNKNGRLTVLQSDKIRNTFADNLASFHNKNMKGMFAVRPANSAKPSDYDLVIKDVLDSSATEMSKTGKDVNTILREANELANQKIKEMQSK